MQDRPTAAELLQAAQEFCERDLIPALSGRVAFHARVLRNVLSILSREWEGEEEAVRLEWARLREMLSEAGPDLPPRTSPETRDQVRAYNAELASRIRSGDFDDRMEDTASALYAIVADKLAIANPGYAED